jgi:hypothetical protein
MPNGRVWTFQGRQGNRPEKVAVDLLPNELSPKLLKALEKLYGDKKAQESYGTGTSDKGFLLYSLGLVRQMGNSWNASVVFAPQVHSFLRAQK